MHIVAIITGLLLILIIAQDGFETIILPRRVSRKFRLARLFYTSTWALWSALARKLRPGNRREQYLSYYGPLSLIAMLVVWAIIFIVAFATLHWGLQSPLNVPASSTTFGTYLYMSGTTFFTLGLGDVTPVSALARALTTLEGGTGFAFLALVIGYVPVIYQVFSRREANISLLDARAGSPPSATELISRHAKHPEELLQFLREWESWCAELLESHLSYSVLAYYRSQHEHQSWLAALTTILDTCALLMAGVDDIPTKQVKFTFAIARHAAVDLSQIFGTTPIVATKRLLAADLSRLRALLAAEGLVLKDGDSVEKSLTDIRRTYEPFVDALSQHLLLPLPPWISPPDQIDDWKTSAWDHFLDASPHTLDEAMRMD